MMMNSNVLLLVVVVAAVLLSHTAQCRHLPAGILDQLNPMVCSVPHSDRSDCGYVGATQEICESKGCCWSPAETLTVPWCFHKRADACAGYRVSGVREHSTGLSADLDLKSECRLFGQDVKELSLTVDYETETRIHVKIVDRAGKRYQISEEHLPLPNSPGTTKDSAAYSFSMNQNSFAFKVTRNEDGMTLFDTSSGGVPFIKPLVFEEQFMEVSTRVPLNANIYGFGEVVHAYRRDSRATRQTLWSRDAPTPTDQNIYGSHPFYMELRNGRAHGVFLRNSNGMDIVLENELLTYKVIGGVLDFYIFVGPTPADVVHQYYEVIGYPHMIAYWTLGFHHCRYGYKSLKEVKEVVARYHEAQIPLETMWTDIDYMDKFKDFTLDEVNFPSKEMNSYVNELHSKHQKYVLILDPAIKVEKGYAPYDEGVKEGVFIKMSNGELFPGKVWPGETVFPDYTNPATQIYWTRWIKKFMETVPVDGWWIDMNEPASFCHSSDGPCEDPFAEYGIEQPPAQRSPKMEQQHAFFVEMANENNNGFDPSNPSYKIDNGGWQAPLTFRTVGPDAVQYNNTLHYDLHNLYGHTEAIMTRNSLLDINPGKRPFVLSRSTFAGTGTHAGHWTGDNFSTWESMYYSISAMLSFQLFGIPYVGADICGFIGDVSEELCARWMSLGAFYPFSRNHNSINQRSQEPYLWPSVAQSSRSALNIRYTLLPYYYTLFYQAHKFGMTVVRPFIFEWPNDYAAVTYDRAFLVGGGVMVSPVLEHGARSLDVYFPPGVWYDWYTHRVASDIPEYRNTGKFIHLPAPLHHINVHVRGGFIIPLQKPAMTTYESRKNDFELLVALNADGRAEGDLFVDDGDSWPINESALSYMHLSATPSFDGNKHDLKGEGVFGYKPEGELNAVYVLGLKRKPSAVYVGEQKMSDAKWGYEDASSELVIKDIHVSLGHSFDLSWEYNS